MQWKIFKKIPVKNTIKKIARLQMNSLKLLCQQGARIIFYSVGESLVNSGDPGKIPGNCRAGTASVL